jgi:hypothetical protein
MIFNKPFIPAAILLGFFCLNLQSQGTQSPDKTLPSFARNYNNTIFGKNVFVFEPGMKMKEIQALADSIFKKQTGRGGEFSTNRYALLFKPGKYDLDIKVDYYMEVLGLGSSPEDVVINGAVRSNTTHGNSVLTNFWRSVGNMTIIPTLKSTMIWGVSQAAPLRRVHIKGDLQLFDKGYASGGFLADSKVDGTINSGPQQQWLTRNTDMGKWTGSNWNMMFVGVNGAPSEDWPVKPYTKIAETPVIREKPWIQSDGKGYTLVIPPIMRGSKGPEWVNQVRPERQISLKEFYIVQQGDNAETMNAALGKGKNLFITPGRYFLDKSLKVNKPGTIIYGIGMATLIPEKGNALIEMSDVDGVIVAGLTLDAGKVNSESLMVVGEKGSSASHSENPVILYDIFVRVGGPAEGSATSSLVINSNDVVIDHTWLWRADHGNGVGWDRNRGANGLVVNGSNVTIYGLFNEHYQEYQTLWNGENGRVYFYQSEMPYDPPSADAWKHGSVNGFASYKVSENVKNHEAWGIGIYNVFYNAPCVVDNAIETPVDVEKNMHHMIIFWLNGNKESIVKSIINGKGSAVNQTNRKSVMD